MESNTEQRSAFIQEMKYKLIAERSQFKAAKCIPAILS